LQIAYAFRVLIKIGDLIPVQIITKDKKNVGLEVFKKD